MIPGLGGLSLGGGSSEANSAVETAARGESGIVLNASKGIQSKDILSFAPLALIAVVGVVVVVKALK